MFCCVPKKETEPEFREAALPEAVELAPTKQGPGIFEVTFAAAPGDKLGLQLDAPKGLKLPPMIKGILPGAVQRFNQEGQPNAIEAHDMIVKVGDVSDPALIIPELKKGFLAEAKLTIDRPYHIQSRLHGDLGVKLDATEDSYGAVVTDIESGSIAKYNSENPSMKINKGDRIVSVNGNTFDPSKGWTVLGEKSEKSGATKKSVFGSRANSRFLEEMEGVKDQEIEVTMLKYTTFEK